SGPDLGAEGIIHISAADSPNGKEIVILANEVSSTLSIFEINSCATLTNVTVTADDLIICPGSASSLAAVSFAPATYQWYNGETAIDGATSSTYSATAAGEYSVEFTNTTLNCVGRTQSVEVSLYSTSVVVTQQPVKTTVCADVTEVSFSVATQSPVKTYQWQMKLSPFVTTWTNLTDDVNISGSGTALLQISNLSSEWNNRVFRCRMTNCGPSINSLNGRLIIAQPVEIVEQPVSQIVCPGTDALFTVSAAGSGTLVTNPLKYRWQKFDGFAYVNLSNGALYSGANTSTLTVINVNAADAAVSYRCRITGYCNPNGLNTDLVTITIDDCTPAMEEFAEKSAVVAPTSELDVLLMPNPATGSSVQFRMNGFEGSTEIAIFDAMGKMIRQEKLTVLVNEIYTIELSNVENGLYFVQFIAEGQRVVKQLVVSK
ncbi:MAG: T9SS type A sorting domain-containing protein, partial [Flavobacteriales bacterium]